MIFDSLKNFGSLKERFVVGLISGTSADGIDSAVCKITDKNIEVISFNTYPYTDDTQSIIRAASTLTVQGIAELDIAIGKEFGAACLSEIARSKVPCAHLIGSHGQTIYHHSRLPDAKKVSLQVGCADTIAITTGVPTVYDFRRKDTALDGEGAPLTPYGDFRMYKDKDCKRIILNLGGISNLTILGHSLDEVYGFDCGPANAPLDRIVMRLTNGAKRYDNNGELARSGQIQTKLLEQLIADDQFLKLTPPKSTGFESYGDIFVEDVINQYGKKEDIDLLATLTAFVSKVIAESIRRFVKVFPDEVVVAGGGAKNSYLLELLRKEISSCKVTLSDSLGIPGDSREAAAFAVMAHDFVLGINTSLPSVTGAVRAATLGKIAFP